MYVWNNSRNQVPAAEDYNLQGAENRREALEKHYLKSDRMYVYVVSIYNICLTLQSSQIAGRPPRDFKYTILQHAAQLPLAV